jgi:hypothetical protein
MHVLADFIAMRSMILASRRSQHDCALADES